MEGLTFIGLGLFDVKDISVKGLDAVRDADFVFAEFYTSKLQGSTTEEMEIFFKRQIRILSREEVEGETILLDSAAKGETILLTGGDPMSATTHHSLRLEAMRRAIPVHLIHSSSIFTAVPGLVGLPAYKFGRTTTLVRPEKNFSPTSPYEVIVRNQRMGLHTMVLLDIKSDEDYFMTASEGLKLLIEMEKKIKKKIVAPETEVIVVARAGSENPFVWYGPLEQGMEMDFGSPLHSIVIPGECHFMEKEFLEMFRLVKNQASD